jgi:cyclohexadieny/prephenate dehydrogenase
MVRIDKLVIVGVGLIGGSFALALKATGAVGRVIGVGRSARSIARALELKVIDAAGALDAATLSDAGLVLLAVPVGQMPAVMRSLSLLLGERTIVTDAGSTKQDVVDMARRELRGALPRFVPGHPIAGTEHSGPESGFATLFDGRWCILTPPPGTDEKAVETLVRFWQACGSQVEVMEAAHHDKTLAITSHLPHLIAYTIVGTVADLEEATQSEVIKFSASGFRDFTRIAASDPVMWRDVFLNNREAVLEMLGRFAEDLTALQRAIRWGEGDKLEALFTRTRAIRRGIIDAKQA